MTRDDEFIRTLLFEIEASDYPYVMVSRTLSPPPEAVKRNYHIDLLCDAGLMTSSSGDSYRLTNQGHDYIEAIKSDTIWSKTKEGARQVGGVTLGMMKDIAIGYLKKEAGEKLGLTF
jgi:hypothetical protein